METYLQGNSCRWSIPYLYSFCLSGNFNCVIYLVEWIDAKQMNKIEYVVEMKNLQKLNVYPLEKMFSV